jgi:hypothetical protein
MTTIFKRIALIIGVLVSATVLAALTTTIILAQISGDPLMNFGMRRGSGLRDGRGLIAPNPGAATTETRLYDRGTRGGRQEMGPGLRDGRCPHGPPEF